MTGADIIGALLHADTAVTALVPTARIKGGALPENVALPAILVRTVSSVEHLTLKRGETTRTIDRVSVAIRASSYREQKAVIKAVKTCCAGKTGNIGGGLRVAILTAGTGPDVQGPGNSYEQTQDFKVSFDAET